MQFHVQKVIDSINVKVNVRHPRKKLRELNWVEHNSDWIKEKDVERNFPNRVIYDIKTILHAALVLPSIEILEISQISNPNTRHACT